MFSDINGSIIVTNIEAIKADGDQVILRVPVNFGADLKWVPTSKNITAHAQEVAKHRWRQSGTQAKLRDDFTPDALTLKLTAVVVTHLKLTFNGGTGEYRTHQAGLAPYRLNLAKS